MPSGSTSSQPSHHHQQHQPQQPPRSALQKPSLLSTASAAPSHTQEQRQQQTSVPPPPPPPPRKRHYSFPKALTLEQHQYQHHGLPSTNNSNTMTTTMQYPTQLPTHSHIPSPLSRELPSSTPAGATTTATTPSSYSPLPVLSAPRLTTSFGMHTMPYHQTTMPLNTPANPSALTSVNMQTLDQGKVMFGPVYGTNVQSEMQYSNCNLGPAVRGGGIPGNYALRTTSSMNRDQPYGSHMGRVSYDSENTNMSVRGGGVGKRGRTKRLHYCSYCSKPFTKQSNKKIHERIHTQTYPYFCRNPQCGKKFMWRSSINFHEKNCMRRAGLDPDKAPFRMEDERFTKSRLTTRKSAPYFPQSRQVGEQEIATANELLPQLTTMSNIAATAPLAPVRVDATGNETVIMAPSSRAASAAATTSGAPGVMAPPQMTIQRSNAMPGTSLPPVGVPEVALPGSEHDAIIHGSFFTQ